MVIVSKYSFDCGCEDAVEYGCSGGVRYSVRCCKLHLVDCFDSLNTVQQGVFKRYVHG